MNPMQPKLFFFLIDTLVFAKFIVTLIHDDDDNNLC